MQFKTAEQKNSTVRQQHELHPPRLMESTTTSHVCLTGLAAFQHLCPVSKQGNEELELHIADALLTFKADVWQLLGCPSPPKQSES